MVKKIKVRDMDIEYETDFRSIKYPRLEFKTGKLLLVLPKNHGEETGIIEKHKNWIYKKSLMIDMAKKETGSKKIEAKTEDDLKDFIKNTAQRFSKEPWHKIQFKKMKSKWGSCSIKKTLTFNTLLKYLPESLIEYVVFHELTHLKEKNHTERFWKHIAKKFNDFSKREKELLVYWFLIQDVSQKKQVYSQ
ncbi:MAG: M48 family metallopeptidase [Candidatus Aenigmarchaeota archaeon]|nr:M48 family metallopeptidase [Candidatus Aenigmarchaeota archaeon]